MKNFLPLLMISLMVSACEKKQPEAGATGGGAAAKNAAYNVSAVEGYIVKTGELSENVVAAGTLIPAEETELHPEASGRVVTINLPEGKNVRKNELLLKIFDQDIQTQLRKLETQLKQAEITEQRLGELLKVKGVSQQEYDLAALQVQNLKNEMELLRINISKTELRAPYDGILGLRNISPGAYVTPSTAVTTIRANSGLKLDFSIPEKYSKEIRVGQTLTFTVEGNSAPFQASVIATEQSISSDTRNLRVRASVRGEGRNLLPGAFAEVTLALGKNNRALLVPSQAIIPQARDKKVFVSQNGKAQLVTVKTGVRQASMVEITSGLSPGDTIATTGILFLRPETPMKFSKIE